jgi:4-hydroxy-4-methyl-2-oxoglutarate aldolase
MSEPAAEFFDERDLLPALDALYSPVVADVLDGLGYRRQVLSPHVRALTPVQRISGRVFPARAVTVDEIPAEPYKLEIAAVDAMRAGDVLVVDAGDDRTCGFWGELLTTACLYKGVRGVVMTACTRDLWKIKDLNFPVFGLGSHAADSKGRADIVAIGEPITIAGVAAKRGDFVLGDEDGVVIVPAEVAGKAVRLAQKKAAEENAVRSALALGMPMGEAFRKYGVL